MQQTETSPATIVMRLRAWKSPWRGDGHENTIPLAAEAANYIEAQAAEIERISSQRDAYLDGYKKAFADVVKLHDALRNIQIEAEREQGSWVHLKRVIALNCKQTLAALEQSE